LSLNGHHKENINANSREVHTLCSLDRGGDYRAIGAAHAGGSGEDVETLAQKAELEHLHATFHAAASVHDPVNVDSPEAITQRIREILSI